MLSCASNSALLLFVPAVHTTTVSQLILRCVAATLPVYTNNRTQQHEDAAAECISDLWSTVGCSASTLTFI